MCQNTANWATSYRNIVMPHCNHICHRKPLALGVDSSIWNYTWAYWTPHTPRYIWSWWLGSGLIWSWIWRLFQYFTLLIDKIWLFSDFLLSKSRVDTMIQYAPVQFWLIQLREVIISGENVLNFSWAYSKNSYINAHQKSYNQFHLRPFVGNSNQMFSCWQHKLRPRQITLFYIHLI